MFTQKVCSSSTCTSGCQSNQFPTGKCLQMQDGMSAIASCGAEYLTLQIYYNGECSGSAETQQKPLNQCLADTSGSYAENICSASSSSTLVHIPAKGHMLRR